MTRLTPTAAALAIAYCCLLAIVTLTPTFVPDGTDPGPANLIPFRVISETLRIGSVPWIVTNLSGNILLFVPFGAVVSDVWTWAHRWHRTLLLGLAVSTLIETLQLVIFHGQRKTDIDDVMLNGIGVLLGFLLRCAVRRRYDRYSRGCSANHDAVRSRPASNAIGRPSR